MRRRTFQGSPSAGECDGAAAGRATFADVLREFGAPLWRLTAGYARTSADREDLYQDILLAVWRALPAFRGQASLRTFVYRIGHNRGLSFRARTQRRTNREHDIPPELRDRTPLPDEQFERRRDRARLDAAIGRLQPTLAQPVMLYLEGMSHAEIGDVLGITENNVAVRLNRARERLGRLLRSEAST
jgi:RNA polymerase sigma-70 factor (ECF subfamily)